MVLTRPVTQTKISTTDFGQPVYDWIMANTPTAWTNLALINGWTNKGGASPPSRYRKIGDMVTVQVAVGGGSNGVAIAQLPAGHIPIWEATLLARAGGSPPQAILMVQTTGLVIPYYPAGATTDMCIGILTFPIT